MSQQEQVAGRLQQSLPVLATLALGLWIAYVSFSVDDPQPYLFPQLISVAMILLSVSALVRAIRGANRTGVGIPLDLLLRIAPGIAVMLAYVLVLAPQLGFYTGSAVGFLTLYSLYDPKPHLSIRTWAMRIAVTVGFMLVIYLVFALALQVQTPRGLFL
ncbi:MAG: tripartite tricarboxylate transporter TctB family protein [Filomicrobium sp.]